MSAPTRAPAAHQAPVMTPAEFLFHEAALLDEWRLEEWRDLFTDDGLYWMPLSPTQQPDDLCGSIMRENRAALAMRIRRLRHPRAYAQMPPSRMLRAVGNVRITDDDGTQVTVRSILQASEYRDRRRHDYAAHCMHTLRREGDAFRIVLKRVDLVDCDDTQPIISLPL